MPEFLLIFPISEYFFQLCSFLSLFLSLYILINRLYSLLIILLHLHSMMLGTFFFLFFFFFFFWNIVNLHCCVHFCCIVTQSPIIHIGPGKAPPPHPHTASLTYGCSQEKDGILESKKELWFTTQLQQCRIINQMLERCYWSLGFCSHSCRMNFTNTQAASKQSLYYKKANSSQGCWERVELTVLK